VATTAPVDVRSAISFTTVPVDEEFGTEEVTAKVESDWFPAKG
jgi:hypothetical protein